MIAHKNKQKQQRKNNEEDFTYIVQFSLQKFFALSFPFIFPFFVVLIFILFVIFRVYVLLCSVFLYTHGCDLLVHYSQCAIFPCPEDESCILIRTTTILYCTPVFLSFGHCSVIHSEHEILHFMPWNFFNILTTCSRATLFV